MLLKFGILLISFVVSTQSVTDGSSDNVLVEFDLVTPEDWSSNVIAALQENIAAFTNQFCQINATACGMTSGFSANDVVIAQEYPQLLGVDTLVLFYVRQPNSTSNNELVKTEILEEIVTKNRKKLQTELRVIALAEKLVDDNPEVFRVSRVNHVLVLEPVDQTLNAILIPIVCCLVFILIGVVVGLDINKRLRRKSQIKEIEKMKQGSGRVDQVPTDTSKVFQTNSTPVQLNV